MKYPQKLYICRWFYNARPIKKFCLRKRDRKCSVDNHKCFFIIYERKKK